MCNIEGCCYVNNENITWANLFKDGLGLLDNSKQILADHFVFNVNINFSMSRTFHPNVYLTPVQKKQYAQIVLKASYLALKNFEMLG